MSLMSLRFQLQYLCVICQCIPKSIPCVCQLSAMTLVTYHIDSRRKHHRDDPPPVHHAPVSGAQLSLGSDTHRRCRRPIGTYSFRESTRHVARGELAGARACTDLRRFPRCFSCSGLPFELKVMPHVRSWSLSAETRLLRRYPHGHTGAGFTVRGCRTWVFESLWYYPRLQELLFMVNGPVLLHSLQPGTLLLAPLFCGEEKPSEGVPTDRGNP